MRSCIALLFLYYSFITALIYVFLPPRWPMALQAMGEHLPNPDDMVKAFNLPRSSRPRSHSLSHSTRLADLTLQAQAQVEYLQRWLHNHKQPLRPLELPSEKAGSCSGMLTPTHPLRLNSSAAPTHSKLAQNLHTALAGSGLLPHCHGISLSAEDTEDSRVSVHESVSLSNPFSALEELTISQGAQTPMEATDTKYNASATHPRSCLPYSLRTMP